MSRALKIREYLFHALFFYVKNREIWQTKTWRKAWQNLFSIHQIAWLWWALNSSLPTMFTTLTSNRITEYALSQKNIQEIQIQWNQLPRLMWTLQCDVELKRMSICNSNDWEILNRNHETAEIRQINIQDSHIRVWRNDWTLSWMYQRTCRRKTSDWISAKIYQEIFEFVVCLDSWMNQHKPQAWRKWKRETSEVLECMKHSESGVNAWCRPFTPPIETKRLT